MLSPAANVAPMSETPQPATGFPLHRLRGPNPTSRRDLALDGIRALAVGLVVLTHAAFMTGFTQTGGFLGKLAGRGDFGVYLFFALSAYLLHRRFLAAELEGRALSLWAYALRRAARVLPAYWITLAVVVAVARPPLRSVVLHAFNVQIYQTDPPINSFSQAWSVATELSFYAALPLAALGLARLRRHNPEWPVRALLLTIIGCAAALAFSPAVTVGRDVLPERLLPGVAPVFCTGMLLAEVSAVPSGSVARRVAHWTADPLGCWAVAVAGFVLATTPITGSLLLDPTSGPQLTARILLGSGVAGALLAPVALGVPNSLRALLEAPLVAWFGQVSYGVFLWHVPVFSALFAVTGAPFFRGGFLLLLVGGLPVTVLLAWLSHRFVEAPAISWAARLVRVRAPGDSRPAKASTPGRASA